jgi:hypothetical protein
MSSQITHGDKEINTDLLLDHLQMFAYNKKSLGNGSGSRDNPISLFTDASKKMSPRE